MGAVERIIFNLALNTIVRLVVMAVVMDSIFGIGRAIREHKFNSSMGIDGAIRKIAMVVSIIFLGVIDAVIHINLIAFIPAEARSYLPADTIGLAEFFGLLYLCYEVVSILKNMALCGLPVKGLWKWVQAFLSKYTKELPDTEEQDAEQERNKKMPPPLYEGVELADAVPPEAMKQNQTGTVTAEEMAYKEEDYGKD